MMTGHRWSSGWPGAWCLDCGTEDPTEIALADDRITFTEEGDMIAPPDLHNELKIAQICPCPGSNNHNPYTQRENKT